MNHTMYPTIASALAPGKGNPLVGLLAQVGTVYAESVQKSAGEMWIGSARIVQEHAARAMVDATRDCMAALTQHAADVQQRSLVQLGSANQQVVALVASAMGNALAGGFKAPG